MAATNSGIEYLGYISAYVFLEPCSLSEIENDSLTYFAEIANSTLAISSDEDQHASFPHSLAWVLEDLSKDSREQKVFLKRIIV